MKGNLEKAELWDFGSNESPLKQLARRVEAINARKFPSVPPHARRNQVFRDQTANELTRSIIAFMEVMGGQAERISNTGRQITNGNRTKWVYGTGKNGTADLSAIWRGRSIKIEVKATKGEKQSEDQKKYQQAIEQAGGIYIIARSFEGFLFEFSKVVEGLTHARG